MDKFLNWMSDKVAPRMDKVAQNPWVAGLQDSINKILPMILVGSIITVYNVVRNYLPDIPDLTEIRSYSFGLVSIFMAFFIPYFILTHKKREKMKYIAGMSGIGLFLMITKPAVTETGHLFNFSYFGAGGMFVAIVAGLFVAFLMNLFGGFSFFKDDSAMPGFIQQWFDSLIPIFLVVFIGWFVVIQCNFDLYQFIISLFQPLTDIAQTFPGMLLLYLIPTIFYSMGISGWVFSPILAPIALAAITANAEAGAANIFTDEVVYAFLALGGRGGTLPLSFVMLRAKSKRLSMLGKTCIGPSILNINEPLVFGAVAWNPMLMIPMWINAVASVIIVYVVMSLGIIAPPTEVFSMWYCPEFLQGFFVAGVPGIILTAIVFAVGCVIYYPFFKIYDNKCLEEEQNPELYDTDEDED
ncbi:PTS system cellobiose-specific IIC component [Breznakia sp. PF5-3]|uniref:PTS sugar transporter subunit IIC n=1 Tax=unclassified Breznakia TaxID=2623764 RepID=UPI002406F5A3|nr:MULTISPECIES: PTS transporter subunit EIIC [unclassified Breznakia]MDF9825706.1 PTS system cellobiose-specific IIC component [Breznakia sp. PM6-1]MDF9836532.1 PTS system cellobiose-specific IIC component [Breznakia sp. PF5-3]MDF9838766.1 PTS system cellobiose-specific IIC component [Breznakia sp. PFB2-8]MDF9860792.1 PTS system cellobiose-specific IIC component [Breznakia sp. PH5-24]